MSNQNRLGQIVRFCLSGVVGVGSYYLVLYCLTEYLGVWYIVSATVATIVNYTSNFIFHKLWTFKDKSMDNVHMQVGKYITLVVGLYVFGTASLYLLVEFAHLWYIYTQLILTIVCTAISFAFSRRIFTPKTN